MGTPTQSAKITGKGAFLFNGAVSYYRSKFLRGSFSHNVLVMFTGTAMGQLASVLLSPVLTRIYTPEMFGILGFFSAATAIASVVSALRYEMALPMAKTEKDAANLLAVCLIALVATTAIACLAIAALSMTGMPQHWFGTLAPYRWLLPAGFCCIGAYQVMVYFATRESDFRLIARTKIYQGLAGPISQIGLALTGAGAWGLIIGFIVGQSTGIGMLLSRLVGVPRRWRHVWRLRMQGLARRYRRFPLISSWSGLLEAAGGSYMLLVAVPLLYSNTIAGFVFLTDRVIGRPLLLISTSILQVYIGDIATTIQQDPEAMRRRFLQLAGQQSKIVGLWLVLVNLAAPPLFPILFGQQWVAAVPYLHVLSIAYFPQMVMHALIHTLQIMERQLMSACWEGGRFLAVAGVFLAGFLYHWNALQTLLAYSIVQLLAQGLLFCLMYHSIQSLRKDAYA